MKRRLGVKVSDLKDQTGTCQPRPMLWCPRCGAECSANKGDYFMADLAHVFTCCGVNMRLVEKTILLRDVFTEREWRTVRT